MFLLLLYVALALVVSFICSILEAVLLSVTPSFAAASREEGHPWGEHLKRMKEEPDRPLSAILTLNTVAHTFGAAGAGAQAQVVFGETWLSVFSAVLTLLILIGTEIIPKTIGALYWRTLAPGATRLLRVLELALYPFVRMSEVITRIISGGRSAPSVSREELVALAEVGRQAGVMDEDESLLFRNLMRFSSVQARDVMTPRTVMYALPADLSASEALGEDASLRFTRVPVYRGRVDDIVGYVIEAEVMQAAVKGDGATTLEDLAHDVLFVPSILTLRPLFTQLIEQREHVAVVVDEYGGVAGLVTLEDVIETLIGIEIVDEHDTVENMQELARQAWQQRAARLGLAVDDVTLDARFGGGPAEEEEPEQDS